MKLTRRLLSMLLALAMVFALLPMGVAAEETPAEPEPADTLPEETAAEEVEPDAVGAQIPVIGETLEIEPWVNPLYADVLDVEDLPEYEAPEKPDASVQGLYETPEEAAKTVRGYMKRRLESFTFYVNSSERNYDKLLTDILYAAMSHTGVSIEGDYLMWHLAGVVGGEGERTSSGTGYNYTFNVTLAYYTTAAQEAEMNTAVTIVLAQLDARNKTDYEKVKAVYDYICANVTYDYEHLEDTSYYLQFSAYAALVNKTAVCQGYAQLFYRLMLELGVDCRVITGIGGDDVSGYGPHAWNIVAVDGLYYNVDSTWDAGYDEYWWFLNNTWNFVGHYRSAEYETIEFHMTYPMAAEDYDPDVPGEVDPVIDYGQCGDAAIWILDRYGHLEILGEGPMYDYNVYAANMPGWYDWWRECITTVTVGEGITRIGDYSFFELPYLVEATIPDSLTEIGSYSFKECGVLAISELPDTITTIGKQAFYESGVTISELPQSLTYLGREAFGYCQGLNEITIPASVTYMGDYCFTCCAGLTRVTLNNSGNLASNAFMSCTGLTEVVISGNLTSIGARAFQWCKSLTAIVFPVSVTEIRECAFDACTSLNVITFLGDAPVIEDGVFYGVTATAYYPANSTWTESVRQDYGGTITWVSTCGHEYESVVTEPTCASQGYTTYTCSICGDSYQDDYTEMLPHTPGEAVTENIVNPTCSAKGSYDRVIYCTVCGHELERVTEEMELLPHAYESVVTPPTCTERGCTTHTCVECGDSYVDSYTDALGHNCTYSVTTIPTEFKPGALTGTCAVCGHGETVELPAISAADYEITVLQEPTDSEPGAAVCVWKNTEYGEIRFEAVLRPLAVIGDVNGDEEIDILDANLIVAWYNEVRELDDKQLAAADVNGDGEVDIMDANMIVAYYNEVIEEFPAAKK